MKLIFILIILQTIFSCKNEIDSESMKLVVESERVENQNNWQLIFNLNDRAIQIDKTNYIAYNNRGWARWKLKEDSLIILNDINQALNLEPSYLKALRNKIVFYFDKEDWDKVIQLGLSYLSKNEHEYIYSLVGESYNKRNQWVLAKQNLNKAIELDSLDYGALKERGITNRMLNLINESIEDLTNAIRIKNDYAQAYNSRALSFEELGNYCQSFEDYNLAISFDSIGSAYWFNRGTLYLKLGEKEKGCYDLKIAFGLNHPQAMNILNKYCK